VRTTVWVVESLNDQTSRVRTVWTWSSFEKNENRKYSTVVEVRFLWRVWRSVLFSCYPLGYVPLNASTTLRRPVAARAARSASSVDAAVLAFVNFQQNLKCTVFTVIEDEPLVELNEIRLFVHDLASPLNRNHMSKHAYMYGCRFEESAAIYFNYIVNIQLEKLPEYFLIVY